MSQSFKDFHDDDFESHVHGDEHAPSKSKIIKEIGHLFNPTKQHVASTNRLITKIANLNPDNPEIGEGMLRSIVEHAQELQSRLPMEEI